MSDVRDPGGDAVDRILTDLEECKWGPTEVARQARRLRAHIEAMRSGRGEPVAFMRDLDGTGSLHVCAKGDPGGFPVYD